MLPFRVFRNGFRPPPAALIAVLAAPSTPAVGQDLLEEVMVTAQKREESIQEVGIAITAFTGEQMDAFGFTNNTEVGNYTPGVHISGNNAGHTQQFTIRGATQNDFADIAEAPNAVYVDEGYQATGQAQLFANFDMERVEILKGPQGTLFGRNATGGLVHYITRRPTREFEAFADVTYGEENTVRLEGAVSGPLSETLSGRLSAFHNRHDEIFENTFTAADLPPTPGPLVGLGRGPLQGSPDGAADNWNDDQWAVRGQLLFEPNEDVTFWVKGHYAFSQPASGPYQHVATVAFVDDTDGDGMEDNLVDTRFATDFPTTCETVSVNTRTCVNRVEDADFDGVRPDPLGDFFGFREPDGTDGLDIKTDHSTEDNDRVEIYGGTAKMDWDLGWASLIGVINYAEQEKRQSLDVDSGAAPHVIVMNQSEFDWFSAEARLEGEADRFRWIAGLYYLNIDGRYAQGLADTIGGINIFGALFFGPVFNGISLATGGPDGDVFLEATLNAELETNSTSIFGQIDYDLTEQLALSFGLRIINEEKDYIYNDRVYFNTRDSRTDGALFGGASPIMLGGAPLDFLAPHEEDTEDVLWSGKIQLNYTPTDDLLLYAGVNRGVKAGSFNAPLLTFLTPDEYGYEEEILLAYEGGFKSTFWGGKARLNGAIYYYDYKDYQAFQFIGTSGAVFNADAEYYGMELELIANPIDNMDFITGIGLIDPTVEDLEVAPGRAEDVTPSFTPKVQWSGILRYTWPGLIAGGDFAVQADASYASAAFHNINNFGTHKMDPYWLGNFRIDWMSADGHWELGAFVNNVSDTRNQLIGFELTTLCGCDEQSFGKPRWWGVSARYNF